jgi:hypothetical protein
MHYFFTLLRYHAPTCFGPICSPSSGGRVYNMAMVLFLLLSKKKHHSPYYTLGLLMMGYKWVRSM